MANAVRIRYMVKQPRPESNLTHMEFESGRALKLWDGRATMRTLVDALAKLEELDGLSHAGLAEVRTMPMRLPNGTNSAVVAVVGAQRASGWAILMPSAAHFDATGTLGLRQKYETSRLDHAISDAAGNVELCDNTYIHNVELPGTTLNYELTTLQECILRHVIRFLEVEDRCYRCLDNTLLPGLRALDYKAVAELRTDELPTLKTIETYVLSRIPEVSRQTVASALANAGLRLPRSGPRAA